MPHKQLAQLIEIAAEAAPVVSESHAQALAAAGDIYLNPRCVPVVNSVLDQIREHALERAHVREHLAIAGLVDRKIRPMMSQRFN